ncbi:MAG: hypothetical protein Q8P91_01500, partial [bacterium]|nr:hypothetical protein [bacterium]
MKSSIFQYPSFLYSEGEVLDIYKRKFPKIVQEYQDLVEKTYLNPQAFKKEVEERVLVFDRLFSDLAKRFENEEHSLSNLLKLDFELHRNYAFHFWLISYAIHEGPLVDHYLKILAEILKKLYPKEEDFRRIKEAFLRTDYDIFYHKILVDSVSIADLLKEIGGVQDDLSEAKNLKPEERIGIYNGIIEKIENLDKEPAKKLLKMWERHLKSKNLTPIYNMLNQGLDYYQENLEQKKSLGEVGKIVQKTLLLAKEKLPKNEAEELENLYLLTREMLEAKDYTLGRRDIK